MCQRRYDIEGTLNGPISLCPRHVDSGKPLTHPLTHRTIGAYGFTGQNLLIQHGSVERKGRKSLQYQSFDLVRRICNQQVGGSSPSTSSNCIWGNSRVAKGGRL